MRRIVLGIVGAILVTVTCNYDPMVTVYRVRGPEGPGNSPYWSFTDTSTDSKYYEHFGMDATYNSGGYYTEGKVRLKEVGRTWIPRPARDLLHRYLLNGHWEVYIFDPRTTVKDPSPPIPLPLRYPGRRY